MAPAVFIFLITLVTLMFSLTRLNKEREQEKKTTKSCSLQIRTVYRQLGNLFNKRMAFCTEHGSCQW